MIRGMLIVWVLIIACWVGNIVRLVQCDWDTSGSWKGEIVHGIGLVCPPASLGTVWSADK
jgi:hypothetical protein